METTPINQIRKGDTVKFEWLGTTGTGKVIRVNPADVMIQPINHPTLQIPVRCWKVQKV